jgi:hypothetical protein
MSKFEMSKFHHIARWSSNGKNIYISNSKNISHFQMDIFVDFDFCQGKKMGSGLVQGKLATG